MAVSEPVKVPLRWRRIIAALVVLFAAAEVSARIYVHLWAGKAYQSLALYKWSAYGLVRNNPELTSPAFAINSNGFRNLETFSREKPARTLRIIMLGGSVLYSGRVGVGAAQVADQGRVGSDATMAQFLRDRIRADSALQGLNVEVINAGVNYNRALEVASGYLADYVFWDPDLVIVCGSANNFSPYWPPPRKAGELNDIRAEHPWHAEFDRVVNRHTFMSWLEVTLRTASEWSAAVALTRKGVERATDIALAQWAPAAYRAPAGPAAARQFADSAQIQSDLRDYFVYADAIAAGARERDQKVAFFWEYYLGELSGIKPMSAAEKEMFPSIRWRVSDPRDLQYHLFVRDRIHAHADSLGATFIDPLPELRADSETVYNDYLHYTRDGNRRMADAMYDRLAPIIRTAGRSILARSR